MATGEIDVAQLATARAPLALRYARPVVAGLLLLIVIAGAAAASPVATGRGPWFQHPFAIAAGLELVLAGLELTLIVMSRRGAAPGHPAPALRSALIRATGFIMLAVAVIAVVNLAAHRGRSLLQRLLTSNHSRHRANGASAGRHHAVGQSAGDHLGYLVYGLAGVVVLAALIYCVIVVARARVRLRRPGGYAADFTADEPADLLRAIASGSAALHIVDEARAAIIACYVAMEDSLATAGTARAVAETPDELLTRAVAAGLLHGPAASTLTALFYEARFSTHPLAVTAKDAARESLDAISAELAGQGAGAPTVGSPP